MRGPSLDDTPQATAASPADGAWTEWTVMIGEPGLGKPDAMREETGSVKRRSPRGVRLRHVLVAAMIGALAACAGTSDDPLVVTGPVPPGVTPVDMLVVTTRDSVPGPPPRFDGERGKGVSYVEMHVSIPPVADRKVGEVIWPKSSPPDPSREFAVVERRPLTPQGAKAWFDGKSHGRALVFVHGFNTRMEDAVFRLAQFVHDSGTPFAPILFSWPSRGKITQYVYDRESTNFSRDALEDLLRAATADPDIKEVSILAHSMGTWLTMETLRQMAIRDGGLSPKIHDVILAAPDIDGDVFRKQIARLGNPHPRLSMFVSRDDRALDLSRLIAGDVVRAGNIDPNAPEWKETLAKADVNVFDLTDVETPDRLRHGKFAADGDVVRLIGDRLVAGQPITDAHTGIGDRIGGAVAGTIGVVGGAAGAVVGAPFAVLDQVH